MSYCEKGLILWHSKPMRKPGQSKKPTCQGWEATDRIECKFWCPREIQIRMLIKHWGCLSLILKPSITRGLQFYPTCVTCLNTSAKCIISIPPRLKGNPKETGWRSAVKSRRKWNGSRLCPTLVWTCTQKYPIVAACFLRWNACASSQCLLCNSSK